MEPYKNRYAIGEVLYFKEGRDLEDAYAEMSEPAEANLYWVPDHRVCHDLADTKMSVTRCYFWHGGFPIYTLEFDKDGEHYAIRVCEEFMCKK